MENDILDSLNDLGYEGPLTDEVAFAKALDGGPKSLEFTKLVHILAEELKRLCNLEETVNIINNVEESSSFLLELSSFLKELGCPYKCLVTGHMSSRLQSKEDRLLLLDYMISELMAARMVQVDCPRETAPGMEIVMQESPTAKDLKEILIALKFNKPPPNITVELLFSKLETKLKDTIQKEGDKLVGKPLYNKALSEKDWKNLETAFSEMYEEYRLRRETLITRLECTIQSFEWSDRLKSKKDTIQSVYRPTRSALTVKPAVRMCDFLAARTALLHVEKTASASVRKNTRSDVNKVVIGRVPDRGGRPNEQQPPPPEMPSWQQRSAPQGERQKLNEIDKQQSVIGSSTNRYAEGQTQEGHTGHTSGQPGNQPGIIIGTNASGDLRIANIQGYTGQTSGHPGNQPGIIIGTNASGDLRRANIQGHTGQTSGETSNQPGIPIGTNASGDHRRANIQGHSGQTSGQPGNQPGIIIGTNASGDLRRANIQGHTGETSGQPGNQLGIIVGTIASGDLRRANIQGHTGQTSGQSGNQPGIIIGTNASGDLRGANIQGHTWQTSGQPGNQPDVPIGTNGSGELRAINVKRQTQGGFYVQGTIGQPGNQPSVPAGLNVLGNRQAANIKENIQGGHIGHTSGQPGNQPSIPAGMNVLGNRQAANIKQNIQGGYTGHTSGQPGNQPSVLAGTNVSGHLRATNINEHNQGGHPGYTSRQSGNQLGIPIGMYGSENLQVVNIKEKTQGCHTGHTGGQSGNQPGIPVGTNASGVFRGAHMMGHAQGGHTRQTSGQSGNQPGIPIGTDASGNLGAAKPKKRKKLSGAARRRIALEKLAATISEQSAPVGETATENKKAAVKRAGESIDGQTNSPKEPKLNTSSGSVAAIPNVSEDKEASVPAGTNVSGYLRATNIKGHNQGCHTGHTSGQSGNQPGIPVETNASGVLRGANMMGYAQGGHAGQTSGQSGNQPGIPIGKDVSGNLGAAKPKKKKLSGAAKRRIALERLAATISEQSAPVGETASVAENKEATAKRAGESIDGQTNSPKEPKLNTSSESVRVTPSVSEDKEASLPAGTNVSGHLRATNIKVHNQGCHTGHTSGQSGNQPGILVGTNASGVLRGANMMGHAQGGHTGQTSGQSGNQPGIPIGTDASGNLGAAKPKKKKLSGAAKRRIALERLAATISEQSSPVRETAAENKEATAKRAGKSIDGQTNSPKEPKLNTSSETIRVTPSVAEDKESTVKRTRVSTDEQTTTAKKPKLNKSNESVEATLSVAENKESIVKRDKELSNEQTNSAKEPKVQKSSESVAATPSVAKNKEATAKRAQESSDEQTNSAKKPKLNKSTDSVRATSSVVEDKESIAKRAIEISNEHTNSSKKSKFNKSNELVETKTNYYVDKFAKRVRESSNERTNSTKNPKLNNTSHVCPGCRMVVIPKHFPAMQVTEDDVEPIVNVLWQMMLDHPDILHRFNVEKVIAGALHVFCMDQTTADWLVGLTGRRIGRLTLRVVRARDMQNQRHPVKMAWKSKNVWVTELPKVLKMLQRFNTELRTNEWKVVDTLIEDTSVRRIILMDRTSAEFIKSQDYWLFSGLEMSHFKLLEDIESYNNDN